MSLAAWSLPSRRRPGRSCTLLYAADREYVRLIAAGDQAVNADQPFQALEAYSGAIAVRPEAMLAHLKRGMVYRSRGELVEALRDLRRAAELDPMATRPTELLGDTHMSLQRYEQAASSLPGLSRHRRPLRSSVVQARPRSIPGRVWCPGHLVSRAGPRTRGRSGRSASAEGALPARCWRAAGRSTCT